MKTKTSSKKVSTLFFLRQSACRSFPLAPILVAAVLMALCPIQTRANTIVFDTFGPGDTYDTSFGKTVGFGGIAPGAQFTALVSGILATVDLGLTFLEGTTPGSVNVFLYGDAAGLPNNADQTLLGPVTPTSSPNIVSFAVAGGVSVTQGSVYWLVVKPVPFHSFQHTFWNQSLPPVTGSTASTTDDVTWVPGSNILPAFRITVAGVPDSGGTLLIMLGSVAALLTLRRVLRSS